MLADTTGKKPYAQRAVAQQHQHQQSSAHHLPHLSETRPKKQRKRHSPRQHLEPCPNRRDQLPRRDSSWVMGIRFELPVPSIHLEPPVPDDLTQDDATASSQRRVSPSPPITPAQPQRRSCIIVCNQQRSRPFALRSGPVVPVPLSQTKTQAPLLRFPTPNTNAPQDPSLRTPHAPEASSKIVFCPLSSPLPFPRCLVTHSHLPQLEPRDISRRKPPRLPSSLRSVRTSPVPVPPQPLLPCTSTAASIAPVGTLCV